MTTLGIVDLPSKPLWQTCRSARLWFSSACPPRMVLSSFSCACLPHTSSLHSLVCSKLTFYDFHVFAYVVEPCLICTAVIVLRPEWLGLVSWLSGQTCLFLSLVTLVQAPNFCKLSPVLHGYTIAGVLLANKTNQ